MLLRALVQAASEVMNASSTSSPLPHLHSREVPRFLLHLMGELTRCLKAHRPTTPEALPCALSLLCRTAALQCRVLRLLLEAVPQGSGSKTSPPNFAPQLLSACASLCMELRSSLNACGTLRSQPTSACSPEELCPLLAAAFRLVQMQRSMCASLKQARHQPLVQPDESSSSNMAPPRVGAKKSKSMGGKQARRRHVGGQVFAESDAMSSPHGHETRGEGDNIRRSGGKQPAGHNGMANLGLPRVLLRVEQLQQTVEDLQSANHLAEIECAEADTDSMCSRLAVSILIVSFASSPSPCMAGGPQQTASRRRIF